jgi:DNA invertase Pin-like site-specific DNA recombinase
LKETKLRAALYARISTHDKGQNPELQLQPLREYCQKRELTIAGEFVDIGISGSKSARPELNRLIDLANKRAIDIVLVWKLDRLGRSLKHLINILDRFSELGIGFISYMDNIDFSSPSGKLMFHIIGAVAEFERDLIRDRVLAGLAHAKSKGRRLGRKPTPPIDQSKVIQLHTDNPDMSVRQIARKLDMGIGTVHKTLLKYRTGEIDFDGFEHSSKDVQQRSD